MLYNNLNFSGTEEKMEEGWKLRYKYGRFKSFMNQSGFKIETGNRLDKLYISKVGEVPIRMPVEGRIKQVIIKRYGSGEWFALLCVEETETPRRRVERAVGIDLGIKRFLTDSEGREVENPRFYERWSV